MNGVAIRLMFRQVSAECLKASVVSVADERMC